MLDLPLPLAAAISNLRHSKEVVIEMKECESAGRRVLFFLQLLQLLENSNLALGEGIYSNCGEGDCEGHVLISTDFNI